MHSWIEAIPLLVARNRAYFALQQRGAKNAAAASHIKKESRMTPFRTIAEKLNAWRRYREAVRELSQLTDRELEDIGVRRGDIPFIAAGAIRQAA
jgi:uncharacterized protein YjiS (DUF1127 family)